MTAAASGGSGGSPLRLDLVSPLPPVRSGIADYSLDLVAELAPRCDLRVVRLPGQPVAPELEERLRLVAAESLGEGGRTPLYQMGNNLYHEAVQELARTRPGLLTLHDVWLHHLLVELTLARGELAPYLEALEAEHGWIGRTVALPPRWGGYGNAVLFALPAHRSLLLAQRGVLVHSRWAAGVLAEELGAAWAADAVEVVPMPIPLPPEPPRQAALELRRRYRIPEAAFVVGSFGFQTPIKRTTVALRALARPELEGAYLLIGGEVSPVLDLEDEARRLGVADRMRVTGFLEEGDFPAAIAAADVCVNLRYPTAGETSASLLRILALGRGAVVSDYAQFAELEEGAVLKVPLGEDREEREIEALARSLGELRQAPARLAEMGREARRYVQREHDPVHAAERLVEACRSLLARDPARRPAPRPGEPDPPTSFTWGVLSSEIEIEGLEEPWREGTRRRLGVVLSNRSAARWLRGESEHGGVVLEVQLLQGDRDFLAGRAWPSLPHDLLPGESHRFTLELRRPPGPEPVRLRIEPHVLGLTGFSALGGTAWEAEV